MNPIPLILLLLLAPAPRLPELGVAVDQSSDDPVLHDRIVASVLATLEERYPDSVNRLEVSVLRTGGDIDELAPIRVDLPLDASLPRSHLQAKIQQPSDEGWRQNGWVMLYVAHYDSVGVIMRRLEEDEPVMPAEIRFVRIETTRFHGEPLTPQILSQLQAQGELFANRFLKAERTLRADDIRNALDVALGQSVIMTYRRDAFVLEFTCKARMQGFIGDEIKLFAPATNKTYRARISGPGRAQWLETLE